MFVSLFIHAKQVKTDKHESSFENILISNWFRCNFFISCILINSLVFKFLKIASLT